MHRLIVAGSCVALVAALTAGAAADTKVGVTAAVNPQAIGQPPTEPERILLVGTDNFANEKISTGPAGQVQLLFVDGSSLSVGPDANVTIDEYVYNPNTKTGKLAISASQGLLRLVGGAISKNTEVTVTTPTMTAGIRGGIGLFDSRPNQPTKAAFLFGAQMRVTAANQTQQVNRPGFQIVVPGPGLPPLPPVKMTLAEINAAVAQLQGRKRSTAGGQGGQQGGGEPQQDQALASSGLSNATGSNLSPGSLTNTNFFQLPFNPNNLTQIQNIVATSTTTNQVSNGIGGVELFGHFYGGDVFVRNSFNPFLNGNLFATPDANGNVNISAKVLGNTLTFTVPNGSGGTQTFSVPFLPGQIYGTGNLQLPTGVANGTMKVTADKQYFSIFGNFTPNNGGQTDKFGLFAGVPTKASQLPTSGVLTYSIDPKFDTLPFVNNTADGSNGLNLPGSGSGVAVSPMYVRASGVTNVAASQGSSQRMTFMQGSLVVAGSAGNQKFGLFGTTGAFFEEAGTNGSVAMSGGLTGYALKCATCVSTRVGSGVASAPIGGPNGVPGNAIYGPTGNYIVAVPDQVNGVPNGASVRNAAGQGQFPFDTLASQQTGNEKFFVNELTQNASPNIGDQTQTTQTLTGYTGGLLENRASNGSIANSGFASAAGGVTITTDASTNRLAASFSLHDLTTPFDSYVLNFGGTSGFSGGRSAFITDQIFAARDQINTSNGPTSTRNGVTVGSNNLIMINANAVPIDFQTFAGPGVTACTCSFMQWGWWAGEVANTTASNSPRERFLGTWVAGQTPNASQIPSTGSAVYNGHMIAVVASNAGRYVAAGNFQQNWNFAAGNGTVAISNFDRNGPAGSAGINMSGTVTSLGGPSNQVNFGGGVSGGGVSGSMQGSFFRSASDPVAGVGGSIGISGTVGGGAYKAHGTFAGQK